MAWMEGTGGSSAVAQPQAQDALRAVAVRPGNAPVEENLELEGEMHDIYSAGELEDAAAA